MYFWVEFMLTEARLFLKIGSYGTIVKQNCLLGPIGRLRSLGMDQREEFRRRLREAVDRVGRKAVARVDGELREDEEDDSVSQGGLTKILSGVRSNPRIFTVKAIADAAGVTVGELLGEKGYELTVADRDELEHIAQWIAKKLGKEGSKIGTSVTTSIQPGKSSGEPRKESTGDEQIERKPVPINPEEKR